MLSIAVQCNRLRKAGKIKRSESEQQFHSSMPEFTKLKSEIEELMHSTLLDLDIAKEQHAKSAEMPSIMDSLNDQYKKMGGISGKEELPPIS